MGWVVVGLVMVAGGCAPPLPQPVDTDDSGSVGDSTTVVAGDSTTTTAIDSTTTTAAHDSTTTDELCGNGIVETSEDCDDHGESATCDADCTPAECGDQTINPLAGEACEGEDLAGETCMSQGFDGGMLACDGCALDTSECQDLPTAPVLALGFSQVKQFDFSWAAVDGSDHYQLLESPAPGEAFAQIRGDVVGESISITMPLCLRYQASYVLRACNEAGCTDSETVDVMGSLAEAVGYLKASNTDAGDFFGESVALSGDGNTLAIGASAEDGSATGIGGDEADDSALNAGAVYVFARDSLGQWSQQAYVKASNTDAVDQFGVSVALSDDGNTLAVGAVSEDSNATGIGGDQANDSTSAAGAVYVFVRGGMGAWSQQAYVKASNTAADDLFGIRVALSGDGNTLAVAATGEDSNATGIGGDQANDSTSAAGAVYVFVRGGMGAWSQQAYVKASNPGTNDVFGYGLALSGDGDTLAVGARYEDSNATGIGGGQADDSALDSGAVYVFVRDGIGAWSPQAYVKASNTSANDQFSRSVALSGDGDTLVVGAHWEDSNATGSGGSQANDSAGDSGAVYVFVRDGIGAWSQQAYIKASNTGGSDQFGVGVAVSGDGNTLAVGANGERSNATGIGGTQANDSASGAGAVYVFVRDGMGAWSQQAYVKASNPGAGDYFGLWVALSDAADTLAVGAYREDGNATGIGGDPSNDFAPDAGAVYLY